jgi:hypothetical protein
MWIKANGGGSKKAKIREVAYVVMAQGRFKGDTKSLSRFRFAFRTAIMKLIDRMERIMDGQKLKKITVEKRASHIGRVDTLRYKKFTFAVRAAFNKKILKTEREMEIKT